MDTTDLAEVRRTLWAAADQMRANSTLGPSEYRGPVLGLIFLAYAEHRFEAIRPELEAKATPRRPVAADDFKARSVLFVPDEARLSTLVALPEAADLGAAADAAMRAIEAHNPELKEVLPKGYQRMEKPVLTALLRLFAPLPRTLSGDAFGLIYEDFLSNFAAAEGKLGGEFFTPYSIVRLIGDHRAVPRSGVRPGVWVGWHVRSVRQIRRASAGFGDRRPVGVRSGAEGGDGSAGEDEPGAPWPVGWDRPR